MNKIHTSLLSLLLVSCIHLPAFAQDLQTKQAEAAFFVNAKVENEHSGFTGTGYVNFDNAPGGYIEWTLFLAETDSQTIFIRYANGATNARAMELKADNTIVAINPVFQPTGAWTNWAIDSVKVFLKQGENKIRLTSLTSDGGPNIDKIDVTGTPGTIFYELSLEIIGNGQVISTPPQDRFEINTVVELQAIADSGWSFFAWQGDLAGAENPCTIMMNSPKQITAVFTTAFDPACQFENSPVGFASVNVLDQAGTTGGLGGDTLTVQTGEQLFTILDARRDPHFDENHPPLVILIEGKLTWHTAEMMDVKETYDLSILGKGPDAQIEGFGLNIFRSHNIIIRNLEFRDTPDDAINVTNELSHHIWIDHCTFSDDPARDPNGNNHDGLVDIKDGASFLTVSWNHFRNHHKTCLLGHSDNNGATDSGRLKTTYHHNWFDNTNSRHPRVRFGEVHVFNNYYDNRSSGMSYGVASTMEADVVVEANYFEKVPHPTYVGYGDSDPGDIIEKNNIYAECGAPETRGTAFDPAVYYHYQTDDPLHLPVLLLKYGGSGKLTTTTRIVPKENAEFHPKNFKLYQNFPNPFNPATSIRFSIVGTVQITVKIFDVSGREQAVLADACFEPGSYRLTWNAVHCTSGVYFCQIQTNTTIETIKMILLH